MRIFSIILIIGLLFSACSKDGFFNPTAINSDGFLGITYTNEAGDIIGPEDPTDWLFYWGHSQYLRMPKLSATEKIIVIPESFGVNPAYPNPFSGSISIELELPVATHMSLVIIDKNLHIVFDTAFYSEAGIPTIIWKGLDNQGRRLPDGVYRVIYDIRIGEGLTGFGDIWLQSKPL